MIFKETMLKGAFLIDLERHRVIDIPYAGAAGMHADGAGAATPMDSSEMAASWTEAGRPRYAPSAPFPRSMPQGRTPVASPAGRATAGAGTSMGSLASATGKMPARRHGLSELFVR